MSKINELEKTVKINHFAVNKYMIDLGYRWTNLGVVRGYISEVWQKGKVKITQNKAVKMYLSNQPTTTKQEEKE